MGQIHLLEAEQHQIDNEEGCGGPAELEQNARPKNVKGGDLAMIEQSQIGLQGPA
ncbi:hypothetical protein D3C71_2006090 [compost metagenome]